MSFSGVFSVTDLAGLTLGLEVGSSNLGISTFFSTGLTTSLAGASLITGSTFLAFSTLPTLLSRALSLSAFGAVAFLVVDLVAVLVVVDLAGVFFVVVLFLAVEVLVEDLAVVAFLVVDLVVFSIREPSFEFERLELVDFAGDFLLGFSSTMSYSLGEYSSTGGSTFLALCFGAGVSYFLERLTISIKSLKVLSIFLIQPYFFRFFLQEYSAKCRYLDS